MEKGVKIVGGLILAAGAGWLIYNKVTKGSWLGAVGDPGNGDNSDAPWNRFQNAVGDPGNGDNSNNKYNRWSNASGLSTASTVKQEFVPAGAGKIKTQVIDGKNYTWKMGAWRLDR